MIQPRIVNLLDYLRPVELQGKKIPNSYECYLGNDHIKVYSGTQDFILKVRNILTGQTQFTKHFKTQSEILEYIRLYETK